MEANNSNIKHLDSDSLLPPRKRLLAGLKRQICDLSSPADTGYDTCLNSPLKIGIINLDLPNDDIVETCRFAAIEAVKAAEAARENAEILAGKAARAMASAKIALDLVATLSEESGKREKSLRKSKMNKGNANSIKDEHSGNTIQIAVEENSPFSGTLVSDSEPPVKENDAVEHKCIESLDSCSKKRGRMKQKKLPLSVCNIKDQTNPKDDVCIQATQENTVIELSKSIFIVEGTSKWKCKALKAPDCVTQNKVMQS